MTVEGVEHGLAVSTGSLLWRVKRMRSGRPELARLLLRAGENDFAGLLNVTIECQSSFHRAVFRTELHKCMHQETSEALPVILLDPDMS